MLRSIPPRGSMPPRRRNDGGGGGQAASAGSGEAWDGDVRKHVYKRGKARKARADREAMAAQHHLRTRRLADFEEASQWLGESLPGADRLMGDALRGIGGLNKMGGIFDGLAKLIETMQEAGGETNETRQLGGDDGPVVSYGLNIRTLAPDGDGGRMDFAPKKPTEKKRRREQSQSLEIEKTLSFDVFETDGEISIIGEIGGVAVEDVRVQRRGKKVTITAGEQTAVVQLLCDAAGKPRSLTLTNGVLKVVYAMKGDH